MTSWSPDARREVARTEVERARQALDAGPDKAKAALWWRCQDCNEEWTAWAPAERHGRETGHARIDLVWANEEER